jgi:hypothetical protein
LKRSPEAEALWQKIEAKRKKFREENPDKVDEVRCPFTSDMVCYSECQDNRNRICINGDDLHPDE